MLDLLEEQWNSEEGGGIEEEQGDDPLVVAVKEFVRKIWKAVARNTGLSFEEGGNLGALALRMLSHCGMEPSVIGEIVCGVLRRAGQAPPNEDVLTELLTLGTHLLLKCVPSLIH